MSLFESEIRRRMRPCEEEVVEKKLDLDRQLQSE